MGIYSRWVFILDFDEGAEPTWRQHWSSDDKVFIYNPHVYKEDMTVDYLATADMARFFMGMVKEAIETKKTCPNFDVEEWCKLA